MRCMTRIAANSIDIEYDTFGDRSASPLLLVMGLGAQMIAWDEEFCGLLADRGHYVVRYDNRDAGLSTRMESAGMPNIAAAMEARSQGRPVENAPYTLNDMASDGVGLMDALEIGAAHIVGASMGGMIVQAMAINHPERVLTLTSIMSTTGRPDLPPAREEAMAVLVTPAPNEREANIEHRVKSSLVIGSKRHHDEAGVRAMAARSFDRAHYPVGMARQMVGIMASAPRHEALGAVRVPTLVIHGADDPLVPVEGGKDTAASVPGAELLILQDMGHDLPRPLWPVIVEAIARNTSRVPARA
jgi:pimeloyl-ACP methyl ester carboxylesterase